jgi:hypothetical protein
MSIRLHFRASGTPPQEFDNQDQPMSFANDNMLRTSEPRFLAPPDGNYAAGAATSFDLACFDVGEDAALKGSTTPATIDLGPNNERLEDDKPHLVNALRELVRQVQ